MSAPSRRNGLLVERIYASCERKQRYPDELTARAAGRMFSEKEGYPLWLYPCRVCRGWHLTKLPQKGRHYVWRNCAYDFERSSQGETHGIAEPIDG